MTRRLAFAAVLAAGAAVRLAGLGDESFWHDESWTRALVGGSFGRLLEQLRLHDAHPPLYYACAWLAARVEPSEAALRLPSALFGIAALPLLYRLGAVLIGPGAGLLAMLLLALSPFHLYFSQEARSYALLFLLCLASLNLLFDLVQRADRRRWLLWAVATAAILLTHYMGAFFVLSEAAVVALHRGRRPGLARECTLAAAGAALLFAPWLPAFLAHGRSLSGGFWIPAPTWTIVGVSLYQLAGHVYWPGLAYGALVVAAFYGPLLAVPILRRRREIAALAQLFWVPIAGELAFSLVRPIFYTRTFIYVLAPLLLLAAAGAAGLPARLRAAAAALLAGALVPATVALLATREKEDWRGAARLLAASSAPGEPIVVDEGYLAVGLEGYGGSADWLARVRRVDHGTLDAPAVSRAAVEAELAGAPGVWVVYRYGNDRGWSARLGPDFERREDWSGLGVHVAHFRRRDH